MMLMGAGYGLVTLAGMVMGCVVAGVFRVRTWYRFITCVVVSLLGFCVTSADIVTV